MRVSMQVAWALLLLLGLQQCVGKHTITIGLQKHQKGHAGVRSANEGDSVRLLNYLDAQVRSRMSYGLCQGVAFVVSLG